MKTSKLAKRKGVTVTQCIDNQTIHICGSFFSKDKNSRICENVEICNPIKNAIKGKVSKVRNLGVVFCKYPHENISYVIYGVDKNE